MERTAMDERELMEVSAYADGELPAEQARALEMRLAGDPELRRELAAFKRLDEAAREISVPDFADSAAREAWRNIAGLTVGLGPAERRAVARMEKAAAALTVPAMSDAAFGRAWEGIVERIVHGGGVAAAAGSAPAPAVRTERWESVWRNIQQRTKPAAQPELRVAEAPALAKSRVTRHASRFRWLAAAGVAALLALGLFSFLTPPQDEDAPVALEVPEALDERYQVQVQYLEGQSSPVVCLFLKDDTSGNGNENGQWQWLPD